MIQLACTKYLVRVRRARETYSWQLSQVASTSEISDGIGHAFTTRSLCSPSENDEYESTKKCVSNYSDASTATSFNKASGSGRAATKGRRIFTLSLSQ